MALALFVLAAATSHSQPAQPYWWSCAAPRHECTAHALKRHVGQQTHGFWQSCRAVQSKARCVIFPYWKQRVVKPVVRQMTRAVRGVGQRFWYMTTGYAPPAQCGASGLTASGIMPYYGVAASSLPFGTRGYVPGYGPFIAEDTGSAVGPGHLDLYFPTCSQALSWGTRWLFITIY